MKNQELKILVIGAGGIGGITAAYIARSGYSIEVADCWPGLAQTIIEKGFHVKTPTESFIQKVPAFSSIDEIKEKKDVILIATKVNSLFSLADAIEPLLKNDSVIVSLQNGMCEEYLSEKFGEKRVLGCAVGWGATVHEPGKLEKTSTGDFIIGTINNKGCNHSNSLQEILSKVATIKCTDNIYGTLYSKLIINSCITTLGAICGLTLGQMLSKYKYRKIFIDTICEAVKVGRAKGIIIEKYAGKINFNEFADRHSFISKLKKHLIIFMVGLKYRKLKSSSLQSLQTGRATEIDFLNGYIVSKAHEYNVNTPVNNHLIRMVKEIEKGIRTISPENFNRSFLTHSFI
jgi:2-dehydropantoate 2-reductase